MRILVVDDSEDWRDLTEAALLAAGYDQVSTAESAEAAYSQLGLTRQPHEHAAAVDLVLLDLIMPEIDGIEACAQIRNDPRYTDMPVIMVTAAHDMESLSNAFVAGATDYITKPFNRVELLARVRSALKLKAELDRRKAREGELIALARADWGERNSSQWVDQETGLLVGIAAEAYLAAASGQADDFIVSVFALAVDRLDALTSAHGQNAKREVLTRVTQAIGTVAAPLGTVVGAYPDGVIVLVAPRLEMTAANKLGQAMRAAIASSHIPNSEAVAFDHATASIGIITARRASTELVADVRHLVKDAAHAGGNRVTAVDRTSHQDRRHGRT